MSVESIGKNAFYDCENLTEVIISKSLTDIGDGAFPESTKIIRK